MSLARNLIERVRMLAWRRRQYDSGALRDHFRRTHDIKVGLYSYGCFDRWRMPGPMRIGRYCSFAKTVRVVDQDHPMTALTTHPIAYDPSFGVVRQGLAPAAPLVILDDVWVGHNVVILPGCKRIGRGAMIGAGSIVTRDVPDYAVVAGVPASIRRQRFPQPLVDRLERTRWWDLEPAELARLEQSWPGFVTAPTVATFDAYLATIGTRAESA